ncbi:uracil-DNA glycosylase [Massilia atriviolacea]|uniref:Uracil-DNA glycosylase n=1 Tax=Massilia atriviolacea TaxID=2495579 RepID=A0A430HQ68_9BURK|nr:uracil-DNA glycosylase [Massilia atriviolacea]RSZ59660.1 uracil-DNA glycosylase [Massilia atriviolacea]
MSTSARDSAFLHEMGIGPLWTLRNAAVADDALADDVAAPLPEAAPAPAAAPVAQAAAVPVAQAAAVPAAQAAAAPAAVPTAVPVAVPTAVPPAMPVPPVPRTAPPAAAPAADSAWGEEPPAPPPTEEEIAAMDWGQLRNAIANCTRCGLCKGGRKPVYGNGAQQARWLVAAGASTASDEKERQPLSGEPGKLLVNMLAAVELSRESNVYVTNLIKCRPTSANGGDRAPSAEEAQACRPYLDRELALSGASMVLTLGQIAANALQGKPLQEALAGSRGQVHEVGGVKLVATLHPGELLRRGADKALAWADLCLARAHDGRPG